MHVTVREIRSFTPVTGVISPSSVHSRLANRAEMLKLTAKFTVHSPKTSFQQVLTIFPFYCGKLERETHTSSFLLPSRNDS